MTRMAGGNGGEGSDKGCQCVPDFLMAMVMQAPAGRSLDRSSGKVSFKIGKKTCKCDYKINAGNCKNSKITCDKKCSGNIKGVEQDQVLEMAEKAQEHQDVHVYPRGWEGQDHHPQLVAGQDQDQQPPLLQYPPPVTMQAALSRLTM